MKTCSNIFFLFFFKEKKKNSTKEWIPAKTESDSKEASGSVKINLDGNVGVQNPVFNKQKGSIAVPAQKHIR